MLYLWNFNDFNLKQIPFFTFQYVRAATQGFFLLLIAVILKPYQPSISTVDALIQLIDGFTAQLDNPNTKFV